MSVLKEKRTLSKAEYVNTANQIYIKTIEFLTRLSVRYSRLLANPVAKLAGEVMDNAEKANSIFPSASDPVRMDLRRSHLRETHAALNALDVRLTHCYWIMSQNPQGCFTTAGGKTVSSTDAMRRMDNMAQELGELIEKEANLLRAVMSSDKRR